ncbi:MAG TPA: hypothetical protein ENH87_14235 [Pricia antarctica]|uniref:Uncharacterized protein n=1 Tax=Pricia antarctica TaxID=641691 RepID=A0A831QRQ2_9FLAO|nr:hypothetical protein [Pricia antarctica]
MNYKFNVRAINTENVEKGTKMSFSVVPYIIAIGVMIAYGFFIYFLIGKVGAEDPDWSRLIYLFSGVEAIVFAAAGFLFGREVNRKRAENAEEEKKRAEIKKEEIKEQVVKERNNALILGAMAIQAEKTALSVTDRSSALEGMTSKTTPASVVSIAEKARTMYPELND